MTEITFAPPPLGVPATCRVFLPSRPRHFDFSDLSRFGAVLVSMMPARDAIYPDEADMWDGNRLVAHMSGMLRIKDFDPGKDYVVLVGDPLLQAATIFALAKYLDSVMLLRYDGQSRSYWPFRMASQI